MKIKKKKSRITFDRTHNKIFHFEILKTNKIQNYSKHKSEIEAT